MRLAVAGATGTVGRLVVAEAVSAGHEAVSLSRADGVDLTTGAGLEPALHGADVVVDVSNVSTLRRRASVRFFEAVTRSLLAAERAAGVRHHVALSIVGIDRVPSGYYAGKVRQEEVIAGGDVPWTILRATQFHEFAGQLAQRVRGPIVPVPRARSAPVAAREVARQLVSLAADDAAGRAPELSGPESLLLPDMVRGLFAARGTRRRVIALPVPGAMAGGLVPSQPGTVGEERFDQWLERTAG